MDSETQQHAGELPVSGDLKSGIPADVLTPVLVQRSIHMSETWNMSIANR